MNLNDVNDNLEEIALRYERDSFLHRMKKMIKGLRQPRDSKAHKEALIEGQRLSAPVSAVLLPLLAIVLLIGLAGGSKTARERPFFPAAKVDKTPPAPILKRISEKADPESETSRTNFETTFGEIDNRSEEPPQPSVLHSPSPEVLAGIPSGPKWKPLPNGSKDGINKRRRKGVEEKQGTPSDKAVMMALRWLKKNQNPDGSWDRNKSAMTGLAVLTFLAHAEIPGASEEFGDTVQKALQFLLDGQNQQSGLYSHQDGHQYSHPIATYAMCEAAAMINNPNIRRSAELALRPIIRGQNPGGGWNYKMENSSGRNDTSYMGWCAQALKAAKLAGLKVDGLDRAVKLAVSGFKQNSTPEGGFGYTGPSRTHGLTAVGTLCLQLLGAGSEPVVNKSLAIMDSWMIGQYDGRNPVGACPQYYFYYATQAKFHDGGSRWDKWDQEMQSAYLSAQRVERGAIKDPEGKNQDIGWWENGDQHTDRPVMDTCLTALQLMVYYRYLSTMTAGAVTVEDEVLAGAVEERGDIKVNIGEL